MPITKTTHEGTLTVKDIGAVAVAKENIDGQVRHLATCHLAGSPTTIQVTVPAKVFRRVRKALAPYLINQAVEEFDGVVKGSGVGNPDPKDVD